MLGEREQKEKKPSRFLAETPGWVEEHSPTWSSKTLVWILAEVLLILYFHGLVVCFPPNPGSALREALGLFCQSLHSPRVYQNAST